MAARVIQGYFIGRGPVRDPGALAPRVGGPALQVQAKAAPGRPALACAPANTGARPSGDDSFEIDPTRLGLGLGLARGGGAALPQTLLAKMEGAFGADFSQVRVHVGSQAARIGAVAFTAGNDIYFAPGRYQPESVIGQQLLGHELAHVVQQRQGRVRSASAGVSIVQDRALEAEADRLGLRAAAYIQRKAADVGVRPMARQIVAGPPGLQPKACAGPPTRSSAIQCATYKNSKPGEARGAVHRFVIGGVRYLEDSGQRRWYWHATNQTWIKIPKGKAPLHNRFTVGATGRGAPRKASFRSQLGSAASYSSTRRRTGMKRTTPIVPIAAPSVGKRTYRANMLAATTAEGVIATNSATTYAAQFGAPVIAGGYNWCHLVGHGGGGSDLAVNIVAASTHANSEQLEIERITYRYKRKGVAIRSIATLVNGSLYLARSITIEVLFNGTVIFSRAIDGFRDDKPSYIELAAVEVKISMAIYAAAGDD
jgi:hypothetical protein